MCHLLSQKLQTVKKMNDYDLALNVKIHNYIIISLSLLLVANKKIPFSKKWYVLLAKYSLLQFAGMSYPTDTFHSKLSIVANAKLPTALFPSYRSVHAAIENDMPPLSYSADISDVFLVSFVSMMEHGRQFHDRRAPWRSSDSCPIEFPFSGQCALQRMPSFTYLAVISSSHLPATDTTVLHGTRNRLFLPFGSSRWYSYPSHEIFNDSPFRLLVFCSLSGSF